MFFCRYRTIRFCTGQETQAIKISNQWWLANQFRWMRNKQFAWLRTDSNGSQSQRQLDKDYALQLDQNLYCSEKIWLLDAISSKQSTISNINSSCISILHVTVKLLINTILAGVSKMSLCLCTKEAYALAPRLHNAQNQARILHCITT